jgi:hypothetical protein
MDDWQADLMVASVIFVQHVCKATQLVPVEVVVEVVVFVAVLVFVEVVVQTGWVQLAPAPVSTQPDRVVKQVRQVAPAVVANPAVQFDSHVVAVASQGHAISQLMKSAQAPPVKLPLA